MVSANIQAEVIDLVADERGLTPEKVRPSDRLLQDLGMDGDDAVEFFDRLHERFGTDLTHLDERWAEHFYPEGFPWRNMLVIIPAIMVGIAIAIAADLHPAWGLVITVALLAGWGLAKTRWGPPDKMVLITVGEVVTAVEAGAWPCRRDA